MGTLQSSADTAASKPCIWDIKNLTVGVIKGKMTNITLPVASVKLQAKFIVLDLGFL